MPPQCKWHSTGWLPNGWVSRGVDDVFSYISCPQKHRYVTTRSLLAVSVLSPRGAPFSYPVAQLTVLGTIGTNPVTSSSVDLGPDIATGVQHLEFSHDSRPVE